MYMKQQGNGVACWYLIYINYYEPKRKKKKRKKRVDSILCHD